MIQPDAPLPPAREILAERARRGDAEAVEMLLDILPAELPPIRAIDRWLIAILPNVGARAPRTDHFYGWARASNTPATA
jgi:hypothetical protein